MEIERSLWSLIAMGLVLALGCLGWIWIYADAERHLRKLRDGKAWLDWRPLPRGVLPLFFGAVALGMLFNMAGIMLLISVSPSENFTDVHPLWQLLISTLSMHLLLTAGLLWLTRWQSVQFDEVPALAGKHFIFDFPKGLSGYFLAFPFVVIGTILTQILLPRLGFQLDPQELMQGLARFDRLHQRIALFSLAVLVVPFCEELVFRGYLFPWMTQRIGFWGGLILHSLLFAWIHFNAASFLPLFAFSCVLGLGYVYTRRLMTAFWMHAIFNAVTLTNFFLSQGTPNG